MKESFVDVVVRTELRKIGVELTVRAHEFSEAFSDVRGNGAFHESSDFSAGFEG
jgi:hypothetical protein